MDILFVNRMPMLTSIDRAIHFRSLIPLKSRSQDDLYMGIDKILRNYNKGGFNIKMIHRDREFEEFMDLIKDDLEVDMNYTARGKHAPEAEGNNRTIGEQIQVAYHNLPYTKVLKVMLKYLEMVSTQQLNHFLAKGGISEYLSPHMIMSKKNIDYNKHCQHTFRIFVQANQENNPTNMQAPRMIDAIYLCPLNNILQVLKLYKNL